MAFPIRFAAGPRSCEILARCSLLLALLAGVAGAQDPPTAEAVDVVASTAAGGYLAPIESEAPANVGLLDRVDRGFAAAVDQMSRVLFYRLFADDETYVQFRASEQYVRPRGSDQAFRRHNPHGSFEMDAIDAPTLKSLVARGIVPVSETGVAVKPGKIGGQEVEFVAVNLSDAGRYVLEDGVYKRVIPPRGLLSETKTLSPAEVDRLGKENRLVLSPEKLAADDPQPYVLQEATGGAPVVVMWLAAGSVFFTFYMRWFNIWGFRHALDIVRGKYDNPAEPGEVTHFQALSSALSATVGLGNIAGVTIAMTIGGPGAFFWMMACGLFGMSSKFVECTLGQKYRHVKDDGTVLGGPMRYLHKGLAELGLAPLGFVLSIVFAIMCIMASFGGGNMFQANQSAAAMLSMFQREDGRQLTDINAQIKDAGAAMDFTALEDLETRKAELTEDMESFRRTFLAAYGVLLAAMVAFVIIGGIKRIGAAAERVVPTMCLLYIASCLWVILMHLGDVPALATSVFSEAFTGRAMRGGFLGVLVVGVQRAAFSNEAGVGSAAIAHSAARTEEPVREGAVALMGPFIDTIVVCSMTALVILITGAWRNEAWVVQQGLEGAALTTRAFEEEISWFPYVLSVAVVLFAYSTIISWSYYGERCWERIFGARTINLYRVIYVSCVFVGAIVNLGAVLAFSDMMILSMAFPNVFGCVLLAPKVKRDLADYWRRYQAGEFKTFK